MKQFPDHGVSEWRPRTALEQHMFPHARNPQATECLGRNGGGWAGVSPAVIVTMLVLMLPLQPPAAGAAEPAAACQPLQLVPPGTSVHNPAGSRWNRVVLLAAPRIASGDAESVSHAIRQRVSQFTLALLATVRQTAGATGERRHELAELGVGYAVPVDGRLTVVAADDPPANAGIDFIGRQILAENGRSLAGLTCVGSSGTVRVFDAEAILFRSGTHQDFLMRHFVWVEPVSGQCSACVWLLSRNAAGGLMVVEEPIRWLVPGTREDRAIHVDSSEFLLGIPTKRSFALVDMPPGQPLAWSSGLRDVAAEKHYSPQGLQSLTVALDRGLQTLREPRLAAPTDSR
jgi:hypothetical protein